VTTSTVSQQIAVLARECGVPLIEPDGRRVRLTPAGRRLAERAVTILAEVEAARLDLDPEAEPAGTVRIAGFATAIRRSLLPLVADLSVSHPRVRLLIHEHEPSEAFGLLAGDDIDLALTYDYNLAPAGFDRSLERTPLWSAPWGLGVPADFPEDRPSTALDVFRRFAEHPWIVNSRNTADEDVVRTVASMAGFEPRIEHRADSLDLLEDLIVAGLGVGLLPTERATIPGVRLLPLAEPDIRLQAHSVIRRGRAGWPPLALVLRLLKTA
jgi:DNA-binding transcriptional LysR family regulator